MLLDPGFRLNLRPMKYPKFFEMYRNAIKNTWTTDEVDFSGDKADLARMTPSERHLIHRLVAFFATGDSIVANNLVLNLYKHVNSPEARMYLSRQLYEEALHVEFYLLLLDTYLEDEKAREDAFHAVEKIPSIKRKGDFCKKWMTSAHAISELKTLEDRRAYMLNVICFAACVEGLFFFGAFAYVYFLRSKGLLHGLASGTNWVFRDESCHMEFAFEVVKTAREEEPELFNDELREKIVAMIDEAIECEMGFAEDVLSEGIAGLSHKDMREYLQYVADQRLAVFDIPAVYGSKNPFSFMELQDVQELTNFFERRVAAYQTGITGDVSFEESF